MKPQNIYALLVAINDYPNPNHKLNGCINDALAVKEFLTERCQGINPNTQIQTQLHLKTLFDEQATKANIVEAFRTHLAHSQEDDIVLFYYCGHGAREICPPQFRYLEPDGKNQSIVCYDSRDPNNPTPYDLADKESAYLISEVSQNNANIIVIMDCCHSGSATRSMKNSLVKSRQIELNPVIRPLHSFIGYEHISPETQEIKVPKGNHILLSASRNTQTAKETYCEGKQHGVFTYALLKVLRQAKSPLSYSEIMRRVRPLVTNLVTEQHPDIEVVTAENTTSMNQELHKKFLNGNIQPQDNFYTVTYDQNQQEWMINVGAVHGLPEKKSGEKIVFAIYPENTENQQLTKSLTDAYALKVFTNFSVIEFDGGVDATDLNAVYRAKIKELPIQKVGFWLDCAPEMKAHLQKQLENEILNYAQILENQQDAIYKITTQTQENGVKKYRISRSENTIPLVKDYLYLTNNQEDNTPQLVKDIEQIAKWFYLKNLNNPDTSFPSDAVSLEVYRVLETNDDGQVTESQLIDPDSDFRFEQPPMDGTRDEEYEYYVDFALKIKNHSKRPLWCSLLFMSSAFGVDNSLVSKQLLNENEEVWAWEKRILPIGITAESLKFGITEITETFKLIYSTHDFDSSLFNQDDLFLPESSQNRALGRKKKKVVKEGKKMDWATFTQEITVFSVPQVQNIQQLPENRLLGKGQGIFLKNNGLQAKIQLKSENSLMSAKSSARSRSIETQKVNVPIIFQEIDFESFKFSEGRENDSGLTILELSDIQDATIIHAENPLELAFTYQELAENELVLPVVWDGDIVFPVGLGSSRKEGGTLVKINQLPDFQQERGFGKSVKLMLQKLKAESPLGGNFEYPMLSKVEISDDGEEVTYLGTNQTERLEIVRNEIEKPEIQNVLIFMHGILGETNQMALAAKKAKYSAQTIDSQYDIILTFDYESMNTPLEEVAEQFAKKLREAGIFHRNEKGEIIKTNISKVHLIAHSSGGLVARQFIEKNGGNQVIDHLVMVGTPNLGTPWSRIEDLATLGLTMILSKISLATWAISPLVLVIKQFDKKWKSLDQINPQSDFFKGLNGENIPNPRIPYTIIAGNTQENRLFDDTKTKDNLIKIGSKISSLKDDILNKLIFKNPNDIVASTESILAEELWKNRMQNIDYQIVSCDHMSYFSDKEGLAMLAKIIFEPKSLAIIS